MIIVLSYKTKQSTNIICTLPYTEKKLKIDDFDGLIISGYEALSIKEELSNKYNIYIRDKISERELYILSVAETQGKQEIIIDRFRPEK